MDGQKKPEARKVKIIGTAKKMEKKEEVTSTGPVNNTGNYADRKEQMQAGAAGKPPVQSPSAVQRPSQSGPASRPGGSSPFGTQRPGSSASPSFGSQRPAGSAQRPSSGSAQRPGTVTPSAAQRDHSQTTRSSANSSSGLLGGLLGGGGGKIGMIVIVAVVIYFGIKLLGGGGTDTNTITDLVTGGGNSGGSIVGTLLNAFMGSNSTSTYDFSNGSLLSSVTGGNSGGTYGMNTGVLNRDVADGSRAKYTNVKKAKNVTILVYMCGTDLESRSGMATADVQEMIKAGIGDNVNLLIYTGGCSGWKNTMFSSKVNQIYQIKGNSIVCLESDLGSAYMTEPGTLQYFIEYGYKNFKADRMCLILWDHGGGSVSGYGYDEKAGRGKSMTLAGIKTALQNSHNTFKSQLNDKGMFDFIGFDACLMATVENGLMLSQYADYMIASEETEPGVGWYYTNWLKKLSDNPAMATIDLGKIIADDFVEVCASQCRGQATTLSVVDLAELETTLPSELSEFSAEAADMIQSKKQFKTVATARSNAKEFAQSSGIDQIDLYDFADKLGSTGNELKAVLASAVKYNRTGGGIGDTAHGLSIYFPYKKTSNVRNAVNTYQSIDMDKDYTRCIQAFASLEASGQVAATGQNYSQYYGSGSQQAALPSLAGSLLGSGSGSSGVYGSDLTSLLGGMLGGGSDFSLFDMLGGRAIEDAADYVTENHIDASALVWQGNTITLPGGQMEMITDVAENVFIVEGDSYLDLGMDPKDFEISGDSLTADFDGSWVAFADGEEIKTVAYYFMYKTEEGETVGYVPAIMTNQEYRDVQIKLIVYFGEDGTGKIAGAQIVYPEADDSGTEAKTVIGIGKGTELKFICDEYDQQLNYKGTHVIDSIVLDEEPVIGNAYINPEQQCLVTWCLADIYQNRYWTPSILYQTEQAE